MPIKEMFTSKEPRVDLVEITPSMAQAILDECNTNNRKTREIVIDQYSRDMTNDNWVFDGMPIRFKADGTLFDGQHRLSAIIKSSTSQKVVIVLGLAENAQLVMDSGVKRTVKDNIQLSSGYTYSNFVYAAINMACGSTFKFRRLSASDVETFISYYKTYIDIIQNHFTTTKKGLSSAVIPAVALKALIAGEDKDVVIRFVDTFCDPSFGKMTPGEITIQKLREKMLTECIGRSGSMQYSILKLSERVFEAFKNDTMLTKLYIPNELVFPFINIENVYKEKAVQMEWEVA